MSATEGMTTRDAVAAAIHSAMGGTTAWADLHDQSIGFYRGYADAALAALPIEVDDEAIDKAVDDDLFTFQRLDAVRALIAQHAAAKDAEIERLRGIVNAQKADGGWHGERGRLRADLRVARYERQRVVAERDEARRDLAAARERIKRVEALRGEPSLIPGSTSRYVQVRDIAAALREDGDRDD